MPAKTDRAELVLDTKANIGEGPVWHGARQRLFWVDIMVSQLHEFNPVTGHDRAIDVGQYLGCAVPRKRGGLILGLQRGLAQYSFRTRRFKMICRPDRRAGNRFNDGKCDPAGRLWAGTMSITVEPKKGSLFCLEPNHDCRQVLKHLSISNGLAWSLDSRTMYFIDSPTQVVKAFDYDLETGRIRKPRAVIHIPKRDGAPDGMTIDAEGMLWVAHWGGGCVTRWNPDTGRLLQTLRLPVSQVTSCAFGGRKLDELFITSARESLTHGQLAREPLAGGLFRVRPGVTGLEASAFGG